MKAGRAIVGWLASAVLFGAAALALACGGEDAPDQARDRAASSPVATTMPSATTTPSATPFNLACAVLSPTCTPTPAATGPARTPTATATAAPPPTPTATRTPTATAGPVRTPWSTFVCSFVGNCPPTPTATASAPPPPPPSTRSAGPTRSPSPGPTLGPPPAAAQLRRALLTEQEVGSGWAEVEVGPLTRERNPAFFAEFINLVADQYFAVEVHDARNGAAEFLALRMIADRRFEKLDQATPNGPGQDRARYRYEFVSDGQRQYGELVAWRQGAVVVAMLIEGPGAATCVCDHARRQDDKLRSALR